MSRVHCTIHPPDGREVVALLYNTPQVGQELSVVAPVDPDAGKVWRVARVRQVARLGHYDQDAGLYHALPVTTHVWLETP